MSEFLRLITLQDANTRVVLLGTAVLGLASGVVGAFAVLRRRSLVGDALAHAALPGVCVAFLVTGERNFAALLLGALVFGVLGVACIGLIRAHTRIKEDGAIGLVLATFFGAGIVLSGLIQKMPAGNRAGLDGFIFGKAAAMVRQDVLVIGGVAAVCLAAVGAFYKELKLLCFDRAFAQSLGWPALLLDLALMGLVCLVIVAGLPAVGVVLAAALLIIPGVSARFWTERLSLMLVISGAIGMTAGVMGTGLSATVTLGESGGLPAGPAIVLSAGAIFVVSMLVAPRRGVVAEVLRRRTLKRRMSRQNLLRDLYEAQELCGGKSRPLSEGDALLARSWSAPELSRELAGAEREKLVERSGNGWVLTAAGVDQAARVVRAHRLWELFLIEQADIAPDHVDRDADMVEHVLPRDVVERLEKRLRDEGRLPAVLPESPHPLGSLVAAGGLGVPREGQK